MKSLPACGGVECDWRHNVMFLRHSIDSEKILADLPVKSDIEQLDYRPGALLWSVKASDATRTNMARFGSHKLYREVTVRNLNTTRKLHDLMSKLETTDA